MQDRSDGGRSGATDFSACRVLRCPARVEFLRTCSRRIAGAAALGSISSSRCQIARVPGLSAARKREIRQKRTSISPGWWSQTGSNRRPPACKAGALPTELWPPPGEPDLGNREQASVPISDVPSDPGLVGLGRLERPTSPLSGVRSNHLSYRPESFNAQGPAPGPRERRVGRAASRSSAGSSVKKEKRRRRCPACVGAKADSLF